MSNLTQDDVYRVFNISVLVSGVSALLFKTRSNTRLIMMMEHPSANQVEYVLDVVPSVEYFTRNMSNYVERLALVFSEYDVVYADPIDFIKYEELRNGDIRVIVNINWFDAE